MGSEEAEMVAADAKLLLEERELLLQEVRTLHQQQQEESIGYQQRGEKELILTSGKMKSYALTG